jgi:FADH2-dependent halogenase
VTDPTRLPFGTPARGRAGSSPSEETVDVTRSWAYEVAVIGGGPGGSSAAAALARKGHQVLLLERETFPRFHIGESQLPWSAEVFRALGCEDLIAQAGFVDKWGASFTSHDGRAAQYADFARAVETPRPQTWQVPRDRFDEVLLRHAERSGVEVLQGTRALDATFDAHGATLDYIDTEGVAHTVRVGAVVDASGRAGFLAKRFGRRVVDPVLRNVAVHAQFEGVPRREGRRAGDIQMVTRPDRGWFWFIPITPTVMSVGAVIPKAVHAAVGRPTAEESLQHYVDETPAAAALMRGARRVSPGRFDADYSYLHTQHAGDRWVLVGDAGGFLDPIFSTGVLLAMQSGLEAAAAVGGGLAARNLSRARFAAYERTVQRRYRHFRRFAVGFYDPAFRDLFFARSSRFGIYEAVLSVLAGNWRPSLGTRLRLALFFALVALQRVLPIAARSHSAPWTAKAAVNPTPERTPELGR